MGSIRSYLADIVEHLAYQYSVDLKLDRDQRVYDSVCTSESGPKLMMRGSVWVPGR